MRRLALTTVLLLLPLALTPSRHADGARAASQQCPAITVSCPNVVRPGEEATFTVSVDAAAADVKYTYKWEVSAGTIAGGQGMTSIKVDTTGVVVPVTATVDVGGLPASCTRSASCMTAYIEGPRCGRAFDEYGNIPFEDEQARLDNIAVELQNDPASSGYFICYGGRVGYEGEARARCERAREYISKVRGVAPERLVTVDGGFREDLSVFMWVVPPGATPPSPIPTVDASEVKIVKPKPVPKRRGR